jgi:hypothetical protein
MSVRIGLIGLAALSVSCAQATAYIQVTQLNVDYLKNETVTGNFFSGSPGNVFDTLPGDYQSVRGSFGATEGFVRVAGTVFQQYPFQDQLGVAGSMSFRVLDGTFTPSLQLDSPAKTRVTFRVTDLASGEYRIWTGGYNTSTVTQSGGLAFPAGPGEYQMSFASGPTTPDHIISGSFGILNFSITPEPTTAVFCLGLLPVGRRRR